MKTLIVIIAAVLAQTLGDVCLTRGMKSIGEISTLDPIRLLVIGLQVFTTPDIWLGIGILLIFYLLYLTALSWADLSYVVPATAFGYALNALLARYLLHEQISLKRWIGTFIICIGVAVVARTQQNTTREREAAA
jgi:uncharacterized membrane protein